MPRSATPNYTATSGRLLYSAIESAKLAGVEPKAYLRAATHAALQGDPIPLPHTLAAAAP